MACWHTQANSKELPWMSPSTRWDGNEQVIKRWNTELLNLVTGRCRAEIKTKRRRRRGQEGRQWDGIRILLSNSIVVEWMNECVNFWILFLFLTHKTFRRCWNRLNIMRGDHFLWTFVHFPQQLHLLTWLFRNIAAFWYPLVCFPLILVHVDANTKVCPSLPVLLTASPRRFYDEPRVPFSAAPRFTLCSSLWQYNCVQSSHFQRTNHAWNTAITVLHWRSTSTSILAFWAVVPHCRSGKLVAQYFRVPFHTQAVPWSPGRCCVTCFVAWSSIQWNVWFPIPTLQQQPLSFLLPWVSSLAVYV